jgi:hypothetical protein
VRATVVPPEAIEAIKQRAIPYLPELILEFYNSKAEPGYQSPEHGWWIIPKGNFKISLTTGAVRQLQPDVELGGDPIELWRKAHPSYHFKQAFEAFTRWVEDKETGLEPDPEPEEEVDVNDELKQAVQIAVLPDGKPLTRISALKIYHAVVAKWGKEECRKYSQLSSASAFKDLLHESAENGDSEYFTVIEYVYDKRRDFSLNPTV